MELNILKDLCLFSEKAAVNTSKLILQQLISVFKKVIMKLLAKVPLWHVSTWHN